MQKRLEYTTILKEILLSKAFQDLSRTELGYSNIEDANNLVFSNPMAFLVGLIFDQGISSTLAWTAPFSLHGRLGHLDPAKIAAMSSEELTEVLKQGKALHRYPSTMAENLIDSCRTIVETFGANPQSIWQSTSYVETKKNLLKLRGIGEKKANLGLLMLMRDHGIKFSDGSEIPLALDVHLRRVLSRSGIFDISTEGGRQEVLDAMRSIYPDLPSKLGTALWYVGKNYCHTSTPMCLLCPLGTICQKKT